MNDTDHTTITRSDSPRAQAPADAFRDGASVGVGSLPHRDAPAAAAFAVAEFQIVTVPSLPVRSGYELMVAQGLLGVPGVEVAGDGTFTIDPQRLAVPDQLVTDIEHDAFGGVRALVDLAGRIKLDGRPWKWQHVGPVTLGAVLHNAGVPIDEAFAIASAAVQARIRHVTGYISERLPNSPALVLLDEPLLPSAVTDFPLAPDEIADVLSGALVSVGPGRLAGIHACGDADVALLAAAGPDVVSLPVRSELVEMAGYIDRFLANGGVIAWGVVATDGPVPNSSQRGWRELSDLWCALVQRGCDASALRRQSLVSPHCGLMSHSASVARRIARLTAEIGERVSSQASATRFVLGA